METTDGPKKHVATIIALGMPPPGAMKKRDSGDEAEGSDESQAESDSAASGGEQALGDMWKKLQKGDTAGAYDDFMDAVKQCTAEMKMKDAEKPDSSDAEKKDGDGSSY